LNFRPWLLYPSQHLPFGFGIILSCGVLSQILFDVAEYIVLKQHESYLWVEKRNRVSDVVHTSSIKIEKIPLQ